MFVLHIDLFQAADAEESYAIRFQKDPVIRAQRGLGGDLKKVWSVDFESEDAPDLERIDWDELLDRTVEAWTLSDPVVSGVNWREFVR
jgi:hypothetical protein